MTLSAKLESASDLGVKIQQAKDEVNQGTKTEALKGLLCLELSDLLASTLGLTKDVN